MSDLEHEVKELVDREVVGAAVERFLDTKVGKVIVGRAQAEIDKAVHDLKTMTAIDSTQVIRLQERIRFHENLHGWLADAIIEAENATATLAAIESQD